MGLKFHGYLPTAGSAKKLLDHPSASGGARGVGQGGSTYQAPTLDFLAEVAEEAERHGAESVLVPTGQYCEDPFVSAALLIERTTRLKFMVAFRPGLITPVLAATQMASFQRFSKGRLLLNVTPGVPGPPSNRYGDWLDKAERLDQAGEFLTIVRGSWGEEPFDFEGTYYKVKGAQVVPPEPVPTFYYGGSSELSMAFAAEFADVYLSYTEPVEMVAERFDWVTKRAAEHGRQIKLALSFGVITREDGDEAWALAKSRLADVDEETIRRAQENFMKAGVNNSGARQRLLGKVQGTSVDAAVIGPNLWVGSMLLRQGASPTLVGSYTEVADRLQEYAELGCTEIIGGLGGREAHHFVNGVMPILRERGLLDEATDAAAAAPTSR